MTDEEFAALIEAGRERRNLEFKQSQAWEGEYRVNIIRAILAMSNTRDGGWVVVGMDQQPDGSFRPAGANSMHLGDYREEEMQDRVGEYATPYVSFTVETRAYRGAQFVLVAVQEFDQIPVICKRDYPGVLRRGAIYMRTRGRRPESAEVSNEADMRELIELATDKGIVKMHRRGYRSVEREPGRDAYDQEVEGLL